MRKTWTQQQNSFQGGRRCILPVCKSFVLIFTILCILRIIYDYHHHHQQQQQQQQHGSLMKIGSIVKSMEVKTNHRFKPLRGQNYHHEEDNNIESKLFRNTSTTNSEIPLMDIHRDNIIATTVTVASLVMRSEDSKTTPTIPNKTSEKLLSENRPALSDVRGNLGPAKVITEEKVEDWLKDRWQAAKSMAGDPIPGQHWVEINLERRCKITRIVIDWETAYSSSYTIVGRITKNNENNSNDDINHINHVIAKSSLAKTILQDKKHVIHELRMSDDTSGKVLLPVQYVRLVIHKGATQWGVSIWKFQIFGIEI